MNNVATLILGGGKGTRLFPLTSVRSKPAVPLGGKYRLIDIPISNCINSGLSKIYLLTQFNSLSLHRHIRQTYAFDSFRGGFVEILAAQQTFGDGEDWYQGTADAVRKNLDTVRPSEIDIVLILSGDQLYRMDYRELIQTHIDSGADATIGTLPVNAQDAGGFGIMRLDDTGQVHGFLEKPQTQAELDDIETDPKWMKDQFDIDADGRPYLASMGIYVFNRDFLIEALEATDYEDFGREVFPMAIRAKKVQAHVFDGYWEDIGTIKAFFDCNLALAQSDPPFRMIHESGNIYTRPRYLPPTRIEDCCVKNSLIADGCVIEAGAHVENSIIGLRTRIGPGAVIKNSILMGNDFLPAEIDASDTAKGKPLAGVAGQVHIEGAIVDKNCRIGQGAHIAPFDGMDDDVADGPVQVRDGIICVPKSTVLPPGWTFDNDVIPHTHLDDPLDT